ncbi:Beta-crystallin S [Liparis tanakae]|uniref:Beta-crystallin S n=1 Tax=Liparis tanakae TaxID=230148 RepID=A0A4Z2HWQ3_9TELE|nr:Beta-crystallin S [Liparis tanakae]
MDVTGKLKLCPLPGERNPTKAALVSFPSFTLDGRIVTYHYYCACLPSCRSSSVIQLCVKAAFAGRVFEAPVDCPSSLETFHRREVHSCRALGGRGVFYEHPNFVSL